MSRSVISEEAQADIQQEGLTSRAQCTWTSVEKIISLHKDSRSNWIPNYEGPFMMKKSFYGGVVVLTYMDGEELTHPVNYDAVRKYYA